MSLFLWISCSKAQGWRDGSREGLAVSSHDLFYPIDKLADLGIDTWVIALAPRETSPCRYLCTSVVSLSHCCRHTTPQVLEFRMPAWSREYPSKSLQTFLKSWGEMSLTSVHELHWKGRIRASGGARAINSACGLGQVVGHSGKAGWCSWHWMTAWPSHLASPAWGC